MCNYGLILSSDPSKGAFEAGVWRTLFQMKLPIGCIAGNGLNVFNAALMAQNDPNRLFHFWHEGIINKMMQLNAAMVQKYVEDWSCLAFKDFRIDFLKTLNQDASHFLELRSQLEKLIDENRIRQSKAQLLLILPNPKTFVTEFLTVNHIPSGHLIDHLLLCVALMVFSQQVNKDNDRDASVNAQLSLINAITKRPCSEVIFCDAPDSELRRQLKKLNLKEKIIQPSIFRAPCVFFEKNDIEHHLKTGCLDALKAFNVLSGKKYYLNFNKDAALYHHFSGIIGMPHPDAAINRKLADWMALPPDFTQKKGIEAMKRLLRQSSFRKETLLPAAILEITASKFQIERFQDYTGNAFIENIIDHFESAFSEHFDCIHCTKPEHLLAFFSENVQSRILELPAILSLYSWICNPDKPLSSETIGQIKENALPEDRLVVLGLIYLNLTIQSF